MLRSFVLGLVCLYAAAVQARDIPWVEAHFDREALLFQNHLDIPENVQIYQDIQFRLTTDTVELYLDNAFRVSSRQALEELGEVRLDYFEETQKAELLSIERLRGGKLEDITSAVRTKVINDGSVFDGPQARTLITKVFVIPDLRVNDIIRVRSLRTNTDKDAVEAFSYVGPIIPTFQAQEVSVSIRLDAQRDVYSYFHAWTPVERSYLIGKDQVIVWRASAIRALPPHGFLPDDVITDPLFSLTTMADWQDVDRWATGRMRIKEQKLSPALFETLPFARAKASIDEKVRAVAQFLQSDIRYEGGELGRHGYLPRRPDDVFTSQYGDCKDQVMLALAMLRQMNVKAYPALVRTMRPAMVNVVAPSRAAFDHVIVHIPSAKSAQWFDPAMLPLSDGKPYLGPLIHKQALVLGDGNDALLPIAIKPHPNYEYTTWQNVFLDVVNAGRGQDLAGFTAMTAFGMSAKALAEYAQASDPRALREVVFNNLSGTIGGDIDVKSASLQYGEDGEVTLLSKFYVRGAFREGPNGFYYGLSLGLGDFTTSSAPEGLETNSYPVNSPFPAHERKDIYIRVPKGWKAPKVSAKLNTSVFRYGLTSDKKNDVLGYNRTFQSKRNRVSSAQLRGYQEDVDTVRRDSYPLYVVTADDFKAAAKARPEIAGDVPLNVDVASFVKARSLDLPFDIDAVK